MEPISRQILSQPSSAMGENGEGEVTNCVADPGISRTKKGYIGVSAAIPGSGQKSEAKTLEEIRTESICDLGCQPVSCWNEGDWMVGSLETRTNGREVRGMNCEDSETRKRGTPGETYRAERTVKRPAVSGWSVRSAVAVRRESVSGMVRGVEGPREVETHSRR